MTTRIVEGQLPYTGGTGIAIDTNKVISILLREEDNLIHVNGDNELYTDLQLAVNITPTDDFPVGVTVGKVLAEDGWSQNGLILNWQTTSGDYARWLYGADGKLYFDGGTGTWNQVYYSTEVNALFTALRGELATVAFTGDYNDLINRPAFLQVQADWNESDTNSPAYINNKPTIPTVNDATLTIQKNGNAVATFTANASTNATANITVPNVINNLTTDDPNNALSATQGKNLKADIDNLKAIGRFLSLWDATTGQPVSFPTSLPTPYNYLTGDYYLVSAVSTATPPVNYKPSGSQYTGTASSTTESEELEVGDMYIYDGTVWLLQINHGKTVSFANLAGQPSDNANLATALNAKADTSSLATVATTGDYNDLLNKPTIPSAQIQSDWNEADNTKLDYIKNKPTIPTDTNQLTNGAGYVTASYHDSSKQDALTLPSTPTQGNLVTWGADNETLVDGGAVPTGVPSGGTDGQVLSKVSGNIAWANPTGGGDVYVSSQANNIFTTGMKIWGGTSTDYQSLTPDSNTAYLILADQPTPPSPRTPGVNTLVYYKINDNDTNSTIYDLSGNGVDQTWYGTPGYTTDATYGRVATFDGSSYTEAGSIVDFGSECTFIALFLRDNTSSQHAIVTECATQNAFPIGIACETATKYQGWYAGAGASDPRSITSVTTAQANQWVMIATTRASDGTAKIYINGNLDNTVSGMAAPNYTSGNNLRISNWRDSYYMLQGKFKLFIGENRTWTDQEIADLATEYGFNPS